MGRKWTRPGPFLLVLLFYGQLLSWLRTEDTPNVEHFQDENEAKIFLQNYDQTAQVVWNKFMEAAWNYATNITNENLEEMLHKEMEKSQHTLNFGSKAQLFNITSFKDPVIKRMLRKVQNMNKAALPKEELQEYNELLAYMETMYGTAEVCLQEGPCLLESELKELMATSRDQEELLWVWQGWRDAVGRPLRGVFERYVQLSNKAAAINGYKDMGVLWRMMYSSEDENSTLREDLEHLFQELQLLYLNLHAYVRRSLYRHYGPKYINLQGPIPAHLLGDMWAQSWVNILDLVLPFPKKPLEDITKIMKVQLWKPQKMFEEADKFFTSLGLLPAPPDFWNHSMLEEPYDGREVICQASAWDFYNGHDFRIKKCTKVTVQDLLSIFHQMGHIQYFMQYKNLSMIFRTGANPAFEEAVASAITLSVSSHKQMLNIGLLSLQFQDSKDEINYLMSIALEKVAFIPFGYLLDLYRWKVFDGTIHKDIYNQEWWNLRLKYQGVCPPVPRTEDDFDPGAKYHISANIPYLRYFLSVVLQFQIHEALCKASGDVGPLHQCTIYNSKLAGKLLEDALKLGSSKPWPEVLKNLTGESQMSTRALMSYFKPLMDWLVSENVRHGEILGWPEFECIFEGREKEMASFLGVKLKTDHVKTLQWALLVMSFLLIIMVLLLGRSVYIMHKRLIIQDTETYFLGMIMEPHQAARAQWVLLIFSILMLVCSLSLAIKMVIEWYSKPSWMETE